MKLNLAVAAAILTVMGLSAAPAMAQGLKRAWVSGHGVDAAGCGTPVAPCRSLQYVHDNIIGDGGEIDILDPAGYGAITITKSVSIVNDGAGTAGVQATSGAAITINAVFNGVIYLHGLNIDGVLREGQNGIVFNSGGTLTISNCTIRHFANDGVLLQPTSGTVIVQISDTVASDNPGGSGIEYFVGASSSASVHAVLNRVTTDNEDDGVTVNGTHDSGTLNFSILNSEASNDGDSGINTGTFTNNVLLDIQSSYINGNVATGLMASGSAVVTLSNSSIDQNGAFGISNTTTSPGGIFSTGDNRVLQNVSGPLTGAALQPAARQ
jgi:hypothetical protein